MAQEIKMSASGLKATAAEPAVPADTSELRIPEQSCLNLRKRSLM